MFLWTICFEANGQVRGFYWLAEWVLKRSSAPASYPCFSAPHHHSTSVTEILEPNSREVISARAMLPFKALEELPVTDDDSLFDETVSADVLGPCSSTSDYLQQWSGFPADQRGARPVGREKLA